MNRKQYSPETLLKIDNVIKEIKQKKEELKVYIPDFNVKKTKQTNLESLKEELQTLKADKLPETRRVVAKGFAA